MTIRNSFSTQGRKHEITSAVKLGVKFSTLSRSLLGVCVFGLSVGAFLPLSAQAAAPTLEELMRYSPFQPDVDCETPTKEELPKCKMEEVKDAKGGGIAGFVIYGPQGQVLREMLDTKGSGAIDQLRYYKYGLEVYREIDTNADQRMDQFRWLNSGGSRWGVDLNKDYKIDSWKQISAEEATREAVRALAKGDQAAMAAVLLNKNDIQTLGILGETVTDLAKLSEDIPGQMAAVVQKAKITKETTWTRFDSSMLFPLTAPAEKGKCAHDLTVYGNVIIMADTAQKPLFLQVGELVRVGDAWKLTSVPQWLDPQSKEGLAMVLIRAKLPTQPDGLNPASNLPPAFVLLLEELREIDTKGPKADSGKAEIQAYYKARIVQLKKIAREAPVGDTQADWYKQLIDGIATAYQMGAYENGLKELDSFEKTFRKEQKDSPILPYINFRRLVSEYHGKLAEAGNEDRNKYTDQFVKNLLEFVQEFPKSEDSAEAFWDLGTLHEYSGKLADAKDWYQKLDKNFPENPLAVRARGAMKRLSMKGKAIAVKGRNFDGQTIDTSKMKSNVVAVVFWATWSKPFADELPKLQELHAKYQDKGFEVIGINEDIDSAPIKQFCTQNKIEFQNIVDPGGIDHGQLAAEYGIVTLPTIFLIEKGGTANAAVGTVEELARVVPELLLSKQK